MELTDNFALVSSDVCSDEMNILKKCKPRLLLRERKKEIKRTNSLTNNELLLSGKRGNTRVMHINHIQFLLNLGKVKIIREPLTVY